jgi:hypothetical protein
MTQKFTDADFIKTIMNTCVVYIGIFVQVAYMGENSRHFLKQQGWAYPGITTGKPQGRQHSNLTTFKGTLAR